MRIETHCRNCAKPLAVTLPDNASEAEASNLARLIVGEAWRLRAAITQPNQPPVRVKETIMDAV